MNEDLDPKGGGASSERAAALAALARARSVILRPERLLQGAYAETSDGEPCVANDPDAARWSLLAAIAAESSTLGVEHEAVKHLVESLDKEWSAVLAATVVASMYDSIGDYRSAMARAFGDLAPHADVIAALDAALDGRDRSP